MSRPHVTEPEARPRPDAAGAGVFLATFAIILLAMGALFAVDLFLAGLERRELRSEARHLYEEGLSLSRRGRQLQAVDRFQSAVAAERSNPVYQRALAEAMLTAGKPAEARAIAAAQLQRQPTDAAASLLVARSLVREGKPKEAIPYYHRAIYGVWDQDTVANRVRSRFELVDVLADMGARRELLAELLPLQDQAPTDRDTRRRIAHLFIDAGAPTRAIEILRALLREHGRDAATYAGLGEAELARGNYRSARANLARAVQLAPDDSTIARRLALAQEVIGLDPTQRGIGAEEEYRRSVELLRLTLQAADSCLTAAGASNRDIVDSARAALVARRRRGGGHAAVESNIDLAERVWELRRTECPTAPSDAKKPVALVLERLAQ